MAIVALALASLPFLSHPWYDPVNDASLYVLTARSIAAGEGYSYLGTPFVIRPPGWSFLIAPLAVYPTRFALLNGLVGLFGVACVAGMFAFYRERLGTVVSAALALAVWLNPLFRELSGQVMSDVPGAALVFVALLLERRAARTPSIASNALVGWTIAAGLYLRSVFLLLLPAVLLARLAGWLVARDSESLRSLKLAWPVLAIPVLCWIPWSLRNSGIELPAPPEQVYLHSYEAAMWHEHPWDPGSRKLTWGEIAGRAPENLGLILPLLGGRLQDGPESRWKTALAAVSIACAGVVLVRRRSPAEFLAGGMLASLAVYFAFKPRLALPVYLLLLPAFCEVVLLVLGRFTPRRIAAWAVAALLVVPAALAFDPSGRRAQARREHEAAEKLVARIETRFPGREPLGAPLGWHIGVHTPRPVYSLQIAALRKGPASAFDVIDQHGIAVVATHRKRPSGMSYAQLLGERYEATRAGTWLLFDTRR